MRIGYLIPEFPGQTHIWMWREIVHMQQWVEHLSLISTRRPGDRDRARHAFAEDAAKRTQYLWPLSIGTIIGGLLWALCCHPIGLLRCIGMGFTLPLNGSRLSRLKKTWPLIPSAIALARHANRERLDHLHCHTCAGGALLGMMTKRLIGLPYSLTLNANIDWWGGAMAQKFGESAFTIAITEWLLAQIKRDYPQLRDDQAILGRIGVDCQKWHPPTTPHNSTGDEVRDLEAGSVESNHDRPTRLITVGRMHESKGHHVLLAAVGRLIDDGRDIQLTMVGDGPQRDELEAQVKRLEISDRVTFTGSVSEDRIIELMPNADMFILASYAEPLGVVYMEAMAMGVATIGTNAGGVGEIITTGHDGILVEPDNADALAMAIGQLIDDPAERTRLAQCGRQTIVEKFDARFGAATLYERLTGKRAPGL